MTSPINDNMILPIRIETLPPINRISRDDPRYAILQTIPLKEHDEEDNLDYVYLWIKDDKDYFITVQIRDDEPDYNRYHDYLNYPDYEFNDDDEPTKVVEIQVQTFRYGRDRVIWLSGEKVIVR
jgi:hypothetical protein